MARPTIPAAAVEPEITPAIPPRPWSSGLKWLVSAALLFHLAAQFFATWNAAPPPSDLGQALAAPFEAYIAAARLNQGYRFFAPDPGPSHLLRFEIFDRDGKPVELTEFALPTDKTKGQLPPPELQVGLLSPRARLLYHRYFMLTEQLAQFDPLVIPPEAGNTPERQAREQAFRAFTDSFARELLRRFGGHKVRMQYVMHRMPTPYEFSERQIDLNHTSLDSTHPWTLEFTLPEGK